MAGRCYFVRGGLCSTSSAHYRSVLWRKAKLTPKCQISDALLTSKDLIRPVPSTTVNGQPAAPHSCSPSPPALTGSETYLTDTECTCRPRSRQAQGSRRHFFGGAAPPPRLLAEDEADPAAA
ncbi:hypothetical protein CSUB01_07224 [Colletotrichum sublineola]|uniref:Uncharacterized protein n=1 Tax=Colletotrichum sublineola TaxID=1173701 RepID=A0A066XKV8_COLSU|nr:hypothetical protein CSUB01_07224 [Colletotrichum sublineola]